VPPAHLVVDPFCGTGAVGEACLRAGRAYLGGDQDANAVAATQQRLERVAEGLRSGQYAPEATQRDVRQLYVAGDTVHASAAVRTARAGIHVRA
jgi:tRNA G10  N-methylase Trm11